MTSSSSYLSKLKQDTVDKTQRHAFLHVLARTLKLPLLTPVLPRICLTAFTCAQAFLLQATIQYIEQSTSERKRGEAAWLIVGYACVYVGIAVSTVPQSSLLKPISNPPGLECTLLAKPLSDHHHVSRPHRFGCL